MSFEFVKQSVNGGDLSIAQRQQKQLRYYTVSSVQAEYSSEYYKAFANRKIETADHMLNYVKSIFQETNFLSFHKYLRFPLASATLVNDSIYSELSRVFYADDSCFEYSIRGVKSEKPEFLDDEFGDQIFDKLLFDYNDVIICDKDRDGNPYRYFVSIDNVLSVESEPEYIQRIAFRAHVGDQYGIIYIDTTKYEFYRKENQSEVPDLTFEHNLGYCPASWVSNKVFTEYKSNAVRKSVFTYSRTDFEEYVFLKTLQRMTEPNGVIPITTILKSKKDQKDVQPKVEGMPMSSGIVSGQEPTNQDIYSNPTSAIQTGSVTAIKPILKSDGSYDMDAIQNFIKFHYMDTKNMEYLDERIKDIEHKIIRSIVGDYAEANEAAKNEKQVSKSYTSKKDRLRDMSDALSDATEWSEQTMLDLKYGINNARCKCYYGSDWFLESETEIFELIGKSPNSIETKTLLQRLSSIRNRFNPEKQLRERILYNLLPFASKDDFQLAIERGTVDDTTFMFQTQLPYLIDEFEAEFGDISEFWKSYIDISDTQKVKLISNLIKQQINNKQNT